MRFDNKVIFSFNKHINRLYKGLEIIDLQFKHSKSKILSILNQTIAKNHLKSGIIRLMITRGDSNQKDENVGVYSDSDIYKTIKKARLKKLNVKITQYDENFFNLMISKRGQK